MATVINNKLNHSLNMNSTWSKMFFSWIKVMHTFNTHLEGTYPNLQP